MVGFPDSRRDMRRYLDARMWCMLAVRRMCSDEDGDRSGIVSSSIGDRDIVF